MCHHSNFLVQIQFFTKYRVSEPMCCSLKMIDYIVCRIIPDVADLKIKREKICRQDTSFMKKVRPRCEV